MSRYRFGLAVVVALVLVSVAPQANGAAGTPIASCGQVVTTNAYMIQDLNCPATGGVAVGAHGITIDLKGFTLRGNTASIGVQVSDFDGVTVKNGVVRNFQFGVYSGLADKLIVSNILATGNQSGGISVHGDSVTITGSSAVGNGNIGIDLQGANPTVKSSTVAGNANTGLFVAGASASILKSTALGNAGTGMWISGDAAVLSGNRVEGNAFAGGASDLNLLGILVTGFTVPPVGKKNVVRGN